MMCYRYLLFFEFRSLYDINWTQLLDRMINLSMFFCGICFVNIVEAPVMIIMGWFNIGSHWSWGSGFLVVGDINLANFIPILKQDMDTVIVFQKLGHSPSKWVNLFFSFVNPMVLNSSVSLYWENILVESFSVWAYTHHGESICVQVNVPWLIGKSKSDSSRIKTNRFMPSDERAWGITFNIKPNSI